LHGVRTAAVESSDLVIVQGVGPVGLGVVAWAANREATVVAVDPVDERLAVAESPGAAAVVASDERDVVSVLSS